MFKNVATKCSKIHQEANKKQSCKKEKKNDYVKLHSHIHTHANTFMIAPTQAQAHNSAGMCTGK